MDWLTIAIEEYKTLREECLTSMKMQQSILTFGTATIGIVMSVGFNVWDKTLLPEILFLFLVPTVVYLIILIWLGEVARMFRAGRFLSAIERKINKQFPDMEEPLTWETWLVTQQSDGKTPHHGVRFHYVAIFLFFILISVASILIGNCKLTGSLPYQYIVGINSAESVVILCVVTLAIRTSKQFIKRKETLTL